MADYFDLSFSNTAAQEDAAYGDGEVPTLLVEKDTEF
jgi:hypothetical protein